jgi:hypothetical protein
LIEEDDQRLLQKQLSRTGVLHVNGSQLARLD